MPSDKKQGKEEVYKLLWFNRMPFYTLNPNLEHRYSCISAVFPEFYIHVDSKHCSTFRLTGYKIKSIKTQELTNVHKSLLYIFGTVPGSDDGYTTKLLNPISREAEESFNERERKDKDVYLKERTEYEEAHCLSETLEKYRTEIFDGLVEVAPLYYDRSVSSLHQKQPANC